MYMYIYINAVGVEANTEQAAGNEVERGINGDTNFEESEGETNTSTSKTEEGTAQSVNCNEPPKRMNTRSRGIRQRNEAVGNIET